MGSEHHAPEELLFQGETLRTHIESKQFIKQELERILDQTIDRTEYLCDYDRESDAYLADFFPRRLGLKNAPSKPNILLVIHTPGGSIMAAFSEQIYANPADGQKGILFGLNKNNHISVVSENTDKLRSVRCDFGYLYWGSSEFSLKLSNCALSVNCNGMIGDTGYKRTNKNHMVRNHYFLTEEECEKNNNMKVKRIECYQVIFKEPN